MALVLSGDIKTGTVIIADSGDIPQIVADVANGLNGTIAFTFLSYLRTITVECRSTSARNNFLSGIRMNNGRLTVDSTTYLVRNISFVEHFMSGTDDVWTYTLELYRDDYS